MNKKMFEHVQKFLELPMNQWQEYVDNLPVNERMRLDDCFSDLLEHATRAYGYLNNRMGGSAHSAGVRNSNEMAEKVRRMLGYSYPKKDISF